MFQRRGAPWIGFVEAQKTIEALKEEAEIAERKLIKAKTTLSYKTKEWASLETAPKTLVPTLNQDKEQQKENDGFAFVKEKIIDLSSKENSSKKYQISTVPNSIYQSSEDQPKTASSKVPSVQSEKLKQIYMKTVIDKDLSKISSSEFSSFSGIERPSSEGTSSLIANAYGGVKKEGFYSSDSYESKQLKDPSEIKFTSWEKDFLRKEVSIQTDTDRDRSPVSGNKSLSIADGIEWKTASDVKKPFFQQRKAVSERGIQKMKDIIERQKKLFEESKLNHPQKETDSVFYSKQKYLNSTLEFKNNSSINGLEKADEMLSSDDVYSEHQLKTPLLRKKCRVTSVPEYKGFSTPGEKSGVPTKRNKKSKRKEFENVAAKKSSLKRIKKTVKRKNTDDLLKKDNKKESKVVSPTNEELHSNPYPINSKADTSENSISELKQDESKNQEISDGMLKTSNTKQSKITSSTSEESPSYSLPINSKSDHSEMTTSEHKQDESKTEDVQAKSDDRIHETTNALKMLKSLNFDNKTVSESSVELNTETSEKKENIKPLNSFKSFKRKALKEPDIEHSAHSPKIRHYDVDAVRNYIKTKREERRKRRLEDHKKRIQENEKRKEELQKVYEHQKQSVKCIPKVKPLSPIKLFQGKDTLERKHENKVVDINLKNENKDYIESQHHVNSTDINTESTTDKKEIQSKSEKREKSVVSVSNKSEKGVLSASAADTASSLIQNNNETNSQDRNIEKGEMNNHVEQKETVIESNLFSSSQKINSHEFSAPVKIPSVSNESLSLYQYSSISSVSNPSQLSQTLEVGEVTFQEISNAEIPFVVAKSKHSEKLKNLVKSIDTIIEPYQHLLRTKQWVEESPPPPKQKSRNTNISFIRNGHFEKNLEFFKLSLDIKSDIAQGKPKEESSFKERVTDIGDVSQLCEKILDRSASLKSKSKFCHELLQSDKHAFQESADDLIEGSLTSEENTPISKSELKSDSKHSISESISSSFEFGDLQVNLDPFNFINTWSRKPLGFSQESSRKFEGHSFSPPRIIPVSQGGGSDADNYSSDFISSLEGSNQNKMSSTKYEFENHLTIKNMSAILHSTDKKSSSDQAMKYPAVKHGKQKSVNRCTSSQNVSTSMEEQSATSELLVSEAILNATSNQNVSAAEEQAEEVSESLISGTLSSESVSEDSVVLHTSLEFNDTSKKSRSDSTISEVVSVVANSKAVQNVEKENSIKLPGNEVQLSEKISSDSQSNKSNSVTNSNLNSLNKNKTSVPEIMKSVSSASGKDHSNKYIELDQEITKSLKNNIFNHSHEEKSIHESIFDVSNSKREKQSVHESKKSGNESVQESVRSETESVYESKKSGVESVHDSIKSETDSVQESIRSEIESIHESARSDIESVHESVKSSDSHKNSLPENQNEVSGTDTCEKLSDAVSKHSMIEDALNVPLASSLSTEKSSDSKSSHRQNKLETYSSDIFNNHTSSKASNSILVTNTQAVKVTLGDLAVNSEQKIQGIIIKDDKYIHSNVVTQVASEAAAAAATSAVLAVLETQKALLHKKPFVNAFEATTSSSNLGSRQYSNDFESPQGNKTSSEHTRSASIESNKSKPSSERTIADEVQDEHSPSNDSIPENLASTSEKGVKNTDSLVSYHSKNDSMASSAASILSEPKESHISKGIDNFSQRRNVRKISGNFSSPSPASLSENDSVSSVTLMSSQSILSDVVQQNDSEFSDDSFAQLTLDVIQKMTHEEELRARHQLSLLQFQERTLVEKAHAEMMWLELLKKKLREKGSERKVSAVKKRQKDLILRLRQERAQLKCMQEAYRSICEKHHSLLADKKKLLKEPSTLVYQMLNEKEGSQSSRQSINKVSENPKPRSVSTSSTPTIPSDEVQVEEEEDIPEASELAKSLSHNSSQESVIELQASEHTKSSLTSLNKSQKSSQGVPTPLTKPGQSNSNLSLNSNNSLESAAQGLKKLEASKRHLSKREQRILQRRKHVESLLQWQMKLDSEEMAVRELEQKALELVNQSKKKAKYYVSSSSTPLNDSATQKSEVIDEASSNSKHSHSNTMSSTETPSSITSHISDGKQIESIVEEHFEISGSSTIEDNVADKGNSSPSNAVSSGSIQELKNGSSETSIKTINDTAESSHVEEEVNTDENSAKYVSASAKSDVYSDSFDSSSNRKSSSSASNMEPLKSTGMKKNSPISIRPPLIPRNIKRHDSSGSDDSYTISHSETASDQSDIEVRIHALTQELKLRKAEAEKLKRERKKRYYREQLKEKELSLQKQLDAYNQFVQQTKLELEYQRKCITSSTQTVDTSVVKPQIKWPRTDQTADSRRLRKQSTLFTDAIPPEKKVESTNGSFESESPPSSLQNKGVTLKSDLNAQNETLGNSSSSVVKDITEATKGDEHTSNESSEIQEVSEILPNSSHSSNEESFSVKEIAHSSSDKLFVEAKEVTELLDAAHDLSGVSSESVETSESAQGKVSSQSDVESKSTLHSDTFVSESSSKTLEFSSNEQVPSSNVILRKSISEAGHNSEQSLNSGKKATDDTTHTSDGDLSSTSQSVSNSASVEEELESGDLTESFKCDNSEGCPSPIKSANVTYVADALNVSVPVGINKVSITNNNNSHSSDLEILTSGSNQNDENRAFVTKKHPKTETFVVNVVNYICSSMLGDAFRCMQHISSENFIKKSKTMNSESKVGCNVSISSKNYHNISKCTTPISLESTKKYLLEPSADFIIKKSNEKCAETISKSVLDEYLKDAIHSVIELYKNLNVHTKCSNAEHPEKLNESESKHSKSKTVCNELVECSKNPISNIFSLNAENSIDLLKNNVAPHVQDFNDNSIFNRHPNWLEGNFIASQSEAQLQQQLLLQYPYYYRKIPNKPPPPYTPPVTVEQTSPNIYQLTVVKEKVVEKVDTVKYVTKNIESVVESIADVLLNGKRKGLMINEIPSPDFSLLSQKLGLTMPSQLSFLDLVFDLCKEISLNLYSETIEKPEPWLRPRRLTPKPLFPEDRNKLYSVLLQEVRHELKLSSKNSTESQKKRSLWSVMKLGRKKRDFVDTILISELKEEEPDWISYDQDEVTVKFQIADSILNVLLDDTVHVIQDLEKRISKLS
ncbi:Centrosome-associated protein 350, partial [Stegodyphus mimosarum]